MGSNRARTLRNHADRRELTMIQRGSLFILANAAGDVVHTGDINATEDYVAAGYMRRPAGPPPPPVPEGWSPWIDMFAADLRSDGTVRMRVLSIAKLGRAHPGLDPRNVGRDDLIRHLGSDP
jgi:hypothetical protein